MAVYARCNVCKCRRDVCKQQTTHQRDLTWIAQWQPSRTETRLTKWFGPDLKRAKELAEAQITEWKTQRRRGELGYQSETIVSFGELADKYWDEHAAVEGHNPEKTTFYTVQQMKTWVGASRKVSPLSKVELTTFQNDMRGLQRKLRAEGLKGATVNRYFNILRSIFERGREWGVVQSNPLEFVNPVQQETPVPRFLEKGEVDKLFAAVPNLVNEWGRPISEERKHRVFQYMTVLYHTGARPSSIEGCNWDNGDVDLKNKAIRFITYKGGRHQKKHSYWSPMDAEVLKIVIERGEETNRRGPVFACHDMFKLTRLVVAQSKVNEGKPENMHFTIYGLKHCFATDLLRKGVKLDTIARLLGHTDSRMLQKHYAVYTLSHLRDAQEHFNEEAQAKFEVI